MSDNSKVKQLNINDQLSDLQITIQDDSKVSFESFFDKSHLVVYFYPKNFTPGCTNEAQDFNKYYQDFKDLGCEVLGVSKDSTSSHRKFIEKYSLKFNLVSDQDQAMCKYFGVWQEKKMFNKIYMGIVRYTFLVEKGGKVAFVWKKVRVKNHVNEVLSELKKLL